MEIVKAEPVFDIQYGKSYDLKIDLIETTKILIEIFNTQTGIKYKTYLNNSDKWWEDNSSKFQNDFSKVYEIINNCISKTKDYLKYEIQENTDILSLKIIYINELFSFDTIINIQRLISKNGLTDEKINVLEYQFNKLRDIVSSRNIIYSKKTYIPDGEKIEINNELNNIIFKGSFQNNKRNGYGIDYNPNTGEEIFKGNYKDGYRDGEGSSLSDEFIVTLKAEYKKGRFHGKVINYCTYPGDKSNEVKISNETHYKDGLNHGEQKSYQFCAKTQKHFISAKTNYVNGLENGLCIHFMISPSTSEYRKYHECNMKDGLRHGKYIQYGDGEVIDLKQNYNMGVA